MIVERIPDGERVHLRCVVEWERDQSQRSSERKAGEFSGAEYEAQRFTR